MSAMTSAASIPERIRWAVDQLGINADDRVLEIGCGRGVAASLICPQLTQGSYLGIDRLAIAVAASTACNRLHVERGTARFDQQALEDLDSSVLPRFDKIFASNVNLFWTRPAQRELALARQLLKDCGGLHLFYDSPESTKAYRLAQLLVEHLNQAGYSHSTVTVRLTKSTLIGLSARPGPIPSAT
jgi:cyclopropane fatty-acyl-phospholipid synthase-like methyltransferase